MTDMIGKRIRLARLHRRLTLRELGEALSVSPQAVGQWEKGTPNLSDHRSYQLANTLDVDIDWLRGNKGVDEAVFLSHNRAQFEDKIPLIPFGEALKYFALSRNPYRDVDYETTIIPTVKIIGQGFAVTVPKNQEIPPNIIEDDILIFDNGVKIKEGDVIIGLALNEGLYFTVLATCVTDVDPDNPNNAHYTLLGQKGSDAEEHMNAFSGATPIAVMVEQRRLRPNPTRIREIKKQR